MICLLNSTAIPAQFGWTLAGLAVPFSRQILNGSHAFFLFNILIFIYFLKYEIIETQARDFLTLIISAIGTDHFIGSFWFHSDPKEVPCSSNQITGRGIILQSTVILSGSSQYERGDYCSKNL